MNTFYTFNNIYKFPFIPQDNVMEDYSTFEKVFRAIIQYGFCITAFLFCCFEVFVFHKNADLTRVEYHNYNQNEDSIYPSVSLCFARDIFLDDKLNQLGKDINSKSYQEFLTGRIKWNSEMARIQFDDVTLNFMDYLMAGSIQYSKGVVGLQRVSQNDSTGRNAKFEFMGDVPEIFTGYQDYSTKCFTFEPVYKQEQTISYSGLYLKKEIFPNTTLKHPNFGVYFHYPKRLLKDPTYKLFRIVNADNQIAQRYNYFKIQGMEVIRKRNTATSPCQQGWNNIDDQIIRMIVKDLGCNPPYWNISSYTQCTDHLKLQNLSNPHLQNMPLTTLFPVSPKGITPPCQEIKSIRYDYDQIPINAYLLENDGEDWIHLLFHFEETTFKVIKQVQQMDPLTFITAIGGDLGLFAGIGIMQIILFLHDKLHTILAERNKQQINDNPYIPETINSNEAPQKCDDNWNKSFTLQQDVDKLNRKMSKVVKEIVLLKQK